MEGDERGLEPWLLSILEARRMLGDVSLPQFYILAGRGCFRLLKMGRSSVAEGRSLRAYVASLPTAEITTGRKPERIDPLRPGNRD
jgi:hypothetical protein